MKFILLVFFAFFAATVYGATEYLVRFRFEPESESAMQDLITAEAQVGVKIGFEQHKHHDRFVKYEIKDNWFQIAVKYKEHLAVLEAVHNWLFLKPIDNQDIYEGEGLVYFKHVEGILYGYDDEKVDRLCYSNTYGLHLESTVEYHPRFYLTIEGENIVRSHNADEEPEPIKESILGDFVEESESENDESIEKEE